MLPLFVFLLASTTLVSASHQNCTTTNCADLCNFQGSWITTSEFGPDHGYCICNDMYYTREDHDHGDGVGGESDLTNHQGNPVNCNQRRKFQLTAIVLHCLFGIFSASHWYLWHLNIAIPQMLFGLFGGFAICGAYMAKSKETAGGASICSLVFMLWWFVDLILFINNDHYMDQYGEQLVAW